MDDTFRSNDFGHVSRLCFGLAVLQPAVLAVLYLQRILKYVCYSLRIEHYLHRTVQSHISVEQGFGLVDMPDGAKEECSSRHKGEASNVISPRVV